MIFTVCKWTFDWAERREDLSRSIGYRAHELDRRHSFYMCI
mgnify:CR=1 FL=1